MSRLVIQNCSTNCMQKSLTLYYSTSVQCPDQLAELHIVTYCDWVTPHGITCVKQLQHRKVAIWVIYDHKWLNMHVGVITSKLRLVAVKPDHGTAWLCTSRTDLEVYSSLVKQHSTKIKMMMASLTMPVTARATPTLHARSNRTPAFRSGELAE